MDLFNNPRELISMKRSLTKTHSLYAWTFWNRLNNFTLLRKWSIPLLLSLAVHVYLWISLCSKKVFTICIKRCKIFLHSFICIKHTLSTLSKYSSSVSYPLLHSDLNQPLYSHLNTDRHYGQTIIIIIKKLITSNLEIDVQLVC